MSTGRLILASGSPRRRRLLETLGLEIEIVISSVEELPGVGEPPRDFALRAAADKACEVARSHPGSPVLGADTVVEIDGAILGKPASADDAAEMLRRLSGREHQVHTAVALVCSGGLRSLVDTAKVTFAPLTDPIIRWYVATGEPMDKAGAYAVQGRGSVLVRRVEGSPQTVIGLPVFRLPELFAEHGLDLWSWLETRAG